MRRSRYSTVADINVTSLVDVTMVLLIIFMLTAPFIQAGIRVRLPRTKSTVIKETDAVTVTVTRDGTVYVNDEPLGEAKLEDAILTLKVAGEERVYVRADQDVPYGVVMQVVGEIKAAGIDDVGLITEMKRRGR